MIVLEKVNSFLSRKLEFLEASEDFLIFCRQFLEKDRKKILTNVRFISALYSFYKKDVEKYQKFLKKLRDCLYEIPDFGSVLEYDKYFDKVYRNKISKVKSRAFPA